MTTNTFSAILLGDLNDFIAPGQACVNPIFVDSPAVAPPAATNVKKRIELSFDTTDALDVKSSKGLIKVDKTTKAAKVSLSDCLACSGCVTSAETVLLRAQSVEEFLQTMQSIRDQTHPSFSLACVTLSNQVVGSFAVQFQVSIQEAQTRITRFLKQICGITAVVDAAGLPSFLSQVEVAKEFVARYQAQQHLPLLTSSCPGWVCYAEKTHGRDVLPHLCGVKSPQQVAGHLLKNLDSRVYHVSIMPCPDKKLEASRKEFRRVAEDSHSTEVNCVLTATELCEVMLHFNLGEEHMDRVFHGLTLLPEITHPHPWEVQLGNFSVEEPQAGNSGSLCAFVFRYASRMLFNVVLPESTPLPFKKGRNADTFTLELEIDGKIVLSFATSYGFRNIQDVVRKLKLGQCKSHFVEVMACPGGCANGGGLLVLDPKSGNKKEVAGRVALAMDGKPRWFPPSVPELDTTALHTTFNAVKNEPVNELFQQW